MKIQYLAEIEVPMTKKLVIIPNTSIEHEEWRFITMRDKTTSHLEKVEFDRVRALLKCAICECGKLYKLERADGLKVTIAFQNYEAFKRFVETVHERVESARMK